MNHGSCVLDERGHCCRWNHDHPDVAPRRFTPAECLVAAGALDAAALSVDDDEASQVLAVLADQWREEAR